METTWGALIDQSRDVLKPIPDGDYNVKIVDAEATKSQNGKLMFKVKAEIVDGPSVKRKIFTNLVVSTDNPTALAFFFRNMEHIGITSQFFTQEPNPDQVAQAMLNRNARVTVKTRNWQGQDRNEIAAWLPPLGGGPVAPGTVAGPAGPPLPTASSPSPAAAPTAPLPTADGPKPPTPDAPPPLPI